MFNKLNFNNMKIKIFYLLILLAISLFIFDACSKDPEKPVITLTELGMNNSKTVEIGSDLHVEAEIVAEGKINVIMIEIYSETGGGWSFDTTYTEFAGLKNAEFHKHIEIPLSATPGDYHFHLTVKDQAGNQSTVESELKITN